MRAVACADRSLSVVELPEPAPARGQLVLGVLRCGICGSDLHAREHCDDLGAVMAELDYHDFMSTSSATVVGHEVVGEVVERGRDAHAIGLSPLAPGGYAERVLVEHGRPRRGRGRVRRARRPRAARQDPHRPGQRGGHGLTSGTGRS